MLKTDILIIGAGAVGTALARELSKFKVRVLVCDKNDDVGGDASKSCSGLTSTSATMPVGTLECKLRTISHTMVDLLCRDLDIPIIHCGSIAPVLTDDQMEQVPKLVDRAWQNGVWDYEFLPREDILAMEPTLNPEIKGGIYSPRDSQINQFLMVVAEAENAAENGVEFLLDCEVTGIETGGGRVRRVLTTKGEIEAAWVVNAAGLHCDDIAKMVGECDFSVHPRKGEFYVLGHDTPVKVSHIISSVPTPKTRGVLVIPTTDDNVLVGPTADDVEDKDDRKTTREGLEEVRTKALDPEGYNILVSEKAKGYVGISGIRSTGLTASMALAKYVVHEMQGAGLALERKVGWIRTRRGIVRFGDKTDAEKDALIAKDPRYGNIVCRCEQITEAEIVEAIRRPVGARTLDAVKRRVRAGMGRCQSGFCGPQVLAILARELGIPETEVRKRGVAAYMLAH